MAVNGEAIHGTMPIFPYAVNVTSGAQQPARVHDVGRNGSAGAENVAVLQSITLEWRLSRNGSVVYAMLLLNDDPSLPPLPAIDLPFIVNAPGGIDGRSVRLKRFPHFHFSEN